MNLIYQIHPSDVGLQGDVVVPGDKSISHRAVMFGAIAEGTTTVTGFLQSADCLATMAAFEAMGVKIEIPAAETLIIKGVGLHGLQAPEEGIYLGNSGTSMRLLSGLLAGQRFSSTLTGDHSLQKRPMGRVVNPLREMGAAIDMTGREFAPLRIHGGHHLHAINYQLPVASAQVKSCLLLAGLYAQGEMRVEEPLLTRDHTERLLSAFGCKIKRERYVVVFPGQQKLHATEVFVPGDLSSAAFFIVAASISNHSDIIIRNVGINPTRAGIITILQAMGAQIILHKQRELAGEPVADIQVRSAKLRGVDIASDIMALAIDEFPILCIAAACAEGITQFRGIDELRVKESDRVHAMAQGLKQLGINVQENAEGIAIEGGVMSGGSIDCFDDHRIAMAFAVAGTVASDNLLIQDCTNVQTSFPNFVELAQQIGMGIEVQEK